MILVVETRLSKRSIPGTMNRYKSDRRMMETEDLNIESLRLSYMASLPLLILLSSSDLLEDESNTPQRIADWDSTTEWKTVSCNSLQWGSLKWLGAIFMP